MTRLRSLATRKGFTQVDSSELTRIFETLSVISMIQNMLETGKSDTKVSFWTIA